MVERWAIYEVTLNGPDRGNPFTEVELTTEFKQGDQTFEPHGFYDGNGIYKVRFMPDEVGEWTYTTKSNITELNGKTGQFTCIPPSEENHGPVQVYKDFYLQYADGTPYHQFGTTCYAWVHQGEAMEEQTLQTLVNAPFNKMRMCIFPKDYVYNKNEPVYYPYEGKPLKDWDFTKFNPEFWQHFEKRVQDLLDLGIEADIILFHTYDRWDFENMDAASDDRYIRYAVARLAAFRNVWWSLANEYDIMPAKEESDWDRFFEIIRDHDPYQRLRGIHNCRGWYDHSKPWVTHTSIQTSNMAQGIRYRSQYGKPVIYDECRYEGDVPQGWGNISAQQMVQNFWAGTVSGCYVGHGETYKHPEDLLWWAKGGVLHGESPPRIAFLKDFMADAPPFDTLEPVGDDKGRYVLAKQGEYYLAYTIQPQTITIQLHGDQPYKIDGIDTWNMEILPIGTAQPGEYTFTSLHSDFAYRFTPYAPGEKLRPEAKASADVMQGSAPLTVAFSAAGDLTQHWNFGDGTTSDESNPKHVYEKLGQYTVILTVTDAEGISSTAALTINVLPEAPADIGTHTEFPGSRDGLVFVWHGTLEGSREIEPRDDASIIQDGQMDLTGGAFLAKSVNETLLAACKKSNQLTLECLVTTDNLNQSGPARIISFSKDITHRNFTLGQDGNRFAMRIRTPRTGENGLGGEFTFGRIESGKPTHVIVSYFDGNVYCYINGELVHVSNGTQGDFSNWELYPLLFGDEASGGRNWEGKLSHVAIYSRFVGLEEAAHKFKLIQGK
ncbi:MAG: DUF5060 domain-containing protein [Candidatus Poribacteria bacterium]|nr:DUF5060 domain-containing protein [Candidatus Poribacteria bacterium]